MWVVSQRSCRGDLAISFPYYITSIIHVIAWIVIVRMAWGTVHHNANRVMSLIRWLSMIIVFNFQMASDTFNSMKKKCVVFILSFDVPSTVNYCVWSQTTWRNCQGNSSLPNALIAALGSIGGQYKDRKQAIEKRLWICGNPNKPAHWPHWPQIFRHPQ